MNDKLTPLQDGDLAWERILAHDRSADGLFFYAVRTTGVFCRPSCPSRRPKRANVILFQAAQMAVAAGFRACERCRPLQSDCRDDGRVVSRLCTYLEARADRSVTLAELAKVSGWTESAVFALFRRATGVSPRQFQLGIRARNLRRILSEAASSSITEAMYEAGYSASSRLYSHAADQLGMTPIRYREHGRGQEIQFTTAACLLGHVLVATTTVGICSVLLGDSPDLLEADLRQRFRRAASLTRCLDGSLDEILRCVLDELGGRPMKQTLPMDLQATLFQQRVWQALARIPRGQTRSYMEVAKDIGQPRASRAVARACSQNPIALLIPCHRVVGSDGALTGYRWGKERKRLLLEKEASST